jgi:hypothetical protein
VKRRVAFALGTWQLVVLSACLDQAAEEQLPTEDHLVLYGPGLPEAMRRQMEDIAALRAWTSVTWADDILVKPDRPSGDGAASVQALRLRVGCTDADEVWVCKLFDYAEKVAVASLPSARVHLYEDGLHSYVFQPTVRGRATSLQEEARSLVRRAARFAAWRGDAWFSPGVWSEHVARLDGVWRFSAADQVAVRDRHASAEVRRIDVKRMRSMLDAIAERVGIERVPASNRGAAIVLGQAFSRFGLMSEDAELAAYRSVCADLLGQGLRILWKDHPRLEVGFLDRLRRDLQGVGPIGRLDLPDGVPVEVALAGTEAAAVVSGTSTALFTVEALDLAPALTFADRLRFPIYRRDHRAMASIVSKSIATLQPGGVIDLRAGASLVKAEPQQARR